MKCNEFLFFIRFPESVFFMYVMLFISSVKLNCFQLPFYRELYVREKKKVFANFIVSQGFLQLKQLKQF